jgi:hypothetical protein
MEKIIKDPKKVIICDGRQSLKVNYEGEAGVICDGRRSLKVNDVGEAGVICDERRSLKVNDVGEAGVICDALFRDYIHCIVKHTDTNRGVPIENKLFETCRIRQEWFPFRDDK